MASDASDDGTRGVALMRDAEAAILEGVARGASSWVVGAVTRVAGVADAELVSDARAAGDAARDRVVAELRELFAQDPAEQRATPLEIVRSLRSEVTALLQSRGVKSVARDPFERRAFPDDEYAVVLKSLAELGDEELGPTLLAWGLGKSKVLRHRATRGNSSV
ncbi:MAG: hypothetical protein ACT4OX_00480 [Actinomycetota bacterium]